MKFIKKLETKKNKNTEFCKADYYVLDYNQLLEVNGAKGESGGGGPSGPSSSSSSSSPSNTSSSSSSSSSGSGKGGSSGGQSAPSSSTTNDTSTNIPTDTTSSSPAVTNDGYIENSNYGVANAKPGDKLKRNDGTIVTITQGDINWAKEQLAKESANSNNTPSNPNAPTNNPSNTNPSSGNDTPVNSGNGQTTTNGNASDDSKMSATDKNKVENTATTSEDKISKSIQENWKKQYNYETGYRCDNWVEEVLTDAGYDSSEYLTAGNSYEKTVQQHIDALTSSKTEGVDYTKTLPTADGAYVVFMDDGTETVKQEDGTMVKKNINEHAAILVIKDGVATIYDNSSGNGGNAVYKKDSEGNIMTDANKNLIVSYYDQGVGETSVKNNSMTPTWLYSTYYYQKIQ